MDQNPLEMLANPRTLRRRQIHRFPEATGFAHHRGSRSRMNLLVRTPQLLALSRGIGGEGGIRTSQAQQPKSFIERAFELLRMT